MARIARPHGVRGDLRLQALTNFPERMHRLETVYIGADPEDHDNLVKHQVTYIRPERGKADSWIVHFQGVEDRNEADSFRGRYMLVSLADAVPLENDEVYLFQVMGLEVRTTDEQILGRVEDIIETGANDVYVVRGGPYGEVLIPAIESVVLGINVETGVMRVQLLPGLLPN